MTTRITTDSVRALIDTPQESRPMIDYTPTDMTPTLARSLQGAATAGTMRLAIMDPEKDPVEMFRDHLAPGSGEVWGVMAVDHPRTIGGHDDRPAYGVTTCWTGNGPCSRANAEYYVAAPAVYAAYLQATDEITTLTRQRDEARAARGRLAASLLEWEEAGHVIGFRGTGTLTDMDRAAGLAYLEQHPNPVSDDPDDVMTMGGE